MRVQIESAVCPFAFAVGPSPIANAFLVTRDLARSQKRTEMADPNMEYLWVTEEATATAEATTDGGKADDDATDDHTTDDGDMVGFLQFSIMVEWVIRPTIYVVELQIRPEARRRGLGRRLIATVEAMAAAYDVPYLMLTVFEANTAAVEFYTALGFTPDEHRERGVDYIVMSKEVAGTGSGDDGNTEGGALN